MSFNNGKTKIDVCSSILYIIYGKNMSLRLFVQGRDVSLSIKAPSMCD